MYETRKSMWYLVWAQPLVAVAGVGLAGAVVLGVARWRVAALVQGGIVAVTTLVLALYVASEDDYRGGGITRWEAYDAKELTAGAIALGVAASIMLLLAAARGRHRLGIAASLASTAAGVLAFMSFFANSLN
jgi:hypothetical protein